MASRSESIIASFRDLKREYRSDYAAARPSRFRRQRQGLGGTADAHYASEDKYFQVIEFVRDLERNDPMIGPTLNIAVNQQIQGGFRYDPKTPDPKLNDELKAWMSEWCDDADACTIDGRTTFPMTEELVLRAVLRDGDIMVNPLESGHLQLMECERCKTPRRSVRNIVHGVELDDYRRATAFYFTRGIIDPMQRVEKVGDMDRLEAFDEEGWPQIYHVLDEKRVTQTRGVSAFVAAQDAIGIRDDVEFALLIKQQLAAFMVGEWATNNDYQQPGGQTGTQRDGGPGFAGQQVTLEDIEPGTILQPAAGKTFKVHSSNISSTEALEHIRRILQVVGLQVGMPLIMMMMDASETNFSGWKGAVDISRTYFKAVQKKLARRYHVPVTHGRYRWGMLQRNEFGRGLRAAAKKHGDKFYAHRWNPPGWKTIQPLVDVQADAIRLTTLQSSPRRVSAERGDEFADIVRETVEDNELAIVTAIQASERISKTYGVNVHYRELLNRDLFKGGQLIDSEEIPNPPMNAKPQPAPAPARKSA